VRGHPGDVGFEQIQVEYQRGRHKIGLRQAIETLP
jgi:hypothetical protein